MNGPVFSEAERRKYPLFMTMPGTHLDHKAKTNADLTDLEEWPESPEAENKKSKLGSFRSKYFAKAGKKLAGKSLAGKESYEEFEVLDIK